MDIDEIQGGTIMRINNNISAMNTSRQLGNVSGRLSRSMEKLSSGLRIARAADDAAGLAVSEKLRGQIRGVNAAVRAQQDSVSGLQVAEGALNEVSSMLTRAKELAIQRSGTSDTDAVSAIDAELNQIFNEIDNIETNTEYNGNKLFAGGAPGQFSIYTDINGGTSTLQVTAMDIVTINAGAVDPANAQNNIGIDTSGASPVIEVDDGAGTDLLSTATGAGKTAFDQALVTTTTNMVNVVATNRGTIGSFQNRFEASIRNFEGTAENLQAAESRIRDVDMAKEMVGFTKDTIIQQAAQAMLVQANQLPQNSVGLLR
jgi:flagellin